MRVLLRVSAQLEREAWVDVDETLSRTDFDLEIEHIGNELIEAAFNGGDADYDYNIIDTIDPEDDEDWDDDEDDDIYVPSDPDSVGTYINEVEL